MSGMNNRPINPPPDPSAVVPPIPVAILLFDGVELLDFTGPAEVFLVTEEQRAFRVFTVAETTNPVRAMGNFEILPAYTYETAPPARIVVLPGGNTASVTDAGIRWIRRAKEQAEVTLSVCMGAFLLARAGLLDGVDVTTHAWGIENLRRAAPGARVVAGVRYVDAGTIVSAAGVTAGIDAALHLVERFRGAESARWTAEDWMEYRRETKR